MAPAPDGDVRRSRRHGVVGRRACDLPDRQRAVVALYYLDDHSIAEVADVLGIAEGTVKSSLSQARKTLARTLRIEEVG